MPNDPANPNPDAAALEAQKAAETKFNTEVETRLAARLPDALKAALPDAVKAAMPGVPEKYDLKLPEKALLVADDLAVAADIAKSLGITSNEKAQHLVDTLDAHTKSVVEAQLKARSDAVAKWGTDAAADEELGGKDGSKLTETTAVTDKFMAKFGSPELKDFLSKSGLGNHPALIRAFLRAGKAMKNDTILIPKDGGGGGSGQKKTTAEKLYGEGTVKNSAGATA